MVRCEIDAALETKDGSKAYITTKALNEFDPAISGVNWRLKLESQRAAVLANELKNNRNKLARCVLASSRASPGFFLGASPGSFLGAFLSSLRALLPSRLCSRSRARLVSLPP